MKIYALKEKTGCYVSDNIYKDEEYKKNVVNASLCETKKEADYRAHSTNRYNPDEPFVKVIPLTLLNEMETEMAEQQVSEIEKLALELMEKHKDDKDTFLKLQSIFSSNKVLAASFLPKFEVETNKE